MTKPEELIDRVLKLSEHGISLNECQLAAAAPILAKMLKRAMERLSDLSTHGPRQKAVVDLVFAELDRIVAEGLGEK